MKKYEGLTEGKFEYLMDSVDERCAKESINGRHFFKTAGDVWMGPVGGKGIGKVLCWDKKSFDWIREVLAKMKIEGEKIVVEGWSSQHPWLLQFFVPEKFSLGHKEICKGLSEYNLSLIHI